MLRDMTMNDVQIVEFPYPDDLKKWARPEFPEQAARELLEQQWKKATTAKLPSATELRAASRRM